MEHTQEARGAPLVDGARAAARRPHSKKKTNVAAEQDRPDVRAKRIAYVQAILDIASNKLVFLDEAGFNFSMARRWARSPIGTRAVSREPAARGGNISVIGAVRLSGPVSHYMYDGAIDGNRFTDFVTDRLAPKLSKGDVVIWDNVRFHFDPRARAAIEAQGAIVVHLPPYSPELNPIEECWSLVKSVVRALKPRMVTELVAAVSRAFQSLTRPKIQGFFNHAAYALPE
jgi:transposase